MMKASILPPTKPASSPRPTPSTIDSSHRREADEQRDARAVHDRREDVAALVVGAEQVAWPAALAPTPAAGARRAGPASPGRTGCAARPSVGEQRAEDADAARPPPRRSPPASVRKLCQTSPSKNRGQRRPRVATSARRAVAGHFTVIHLKNMKLSASCTSSTFFFIAQASACWCSGMWPTSSSWILNASRIIALRLACVGLGLRPSASARRPSGCCRRRG